MERIRIQEEKHSPYVLFDGDKAIFEIRGVSIIENADSFYKPLIEEVKKFKEEYSYPLNATFDFHAFNTSTARQILTLLEALKEVPAIVHWVYEDDDEDMREAGEDYQSMVKMNFVFEEKESE